MLSDGIHLVFLLQENVRWDDHECAIAHLFEALDDEEPDILTQWCHSGDCKCYLCVKLAYVVRTH